MEKIIFFGLVIPILGFVLYLGGTAIMNGFSAKNANKEVDNLVEDDENQDSFNSQDKLSDELKKLDNLLSEGV